MTRTERTARRSFASWGAVVIALVIAMGATAVAAPARKATPARVTKAAREAFTQAIAADQRGDLRVALGLYQRAFAIAPHPSAAYNVADVQYRLGDLAAAIRGFETYLAFAPQAADRAQVKTLIDKLARTPGTLRVLVPGPNSPSAIELAEAYIFIDGKLVKQPGVGPAPEATGSQSMVAIPASPGTVVVDVVTTLSYGVTTCSVRPGKTSTCTVRAPPRTDGGVVVSGVAGLRVATEPRGRSLLRKRFTLPDGRRKLVLRDRSFECPALVLEEAKADEVVYAFVDSREWDRAQRCRALTIKQHRLRFDR